MLKNYAKKQKRISRDRNIVFWNIIYRKDRRNTDKPRSDFNARLENFCNRKIISLIDNGNIKEEHFAVAPE